MPLRIFVNDQEQWLEVNEDWQELDFESKIESVRSDPNFYVRVAK